MTAPDVTDADTGERESRASAALGALMLLAAILVLVDAAGLRGDDSTLGPAAAPTLIGVLLGVLGATLLVRSRRSLRTPKNPRRLWRLAALVVLLIAFALVLPFLGYVVSAAILFTGAALLLGAPQPARIVAYGWTLAAIVFLVFDRLIGLTLPAGPWGF
ncbi:tripartite tricarboxylate transporter TctB family protein [Actinoplanes rectilineatus]|uniref:tripartite tricarboxylate transporter TctB family protein n=1 Tax=Actinoplanes rectilineatus TaxID=113571 RepID=UPI0006985D54|nr:tripartite tricarboxylate transporter TctB family protein [Actinoplanes rectilineatus]